MISELLSELRCCDSSRRERSLRTPSVCLESADIRFEPVGRGEEHATKT